IFVVAVYPSGPIGPHRACHAPFCAFGAAATPSRSPRDVSPLAFQHPCMRVGEAAEDEPLPRDETTGRRAVGQPRVTPRTQTARWKVYRPPDVCSGSP